MKIVKFGDGTYGVRVVSLPCLLLYGRPWKWLSISDMLVGEPYWFSSSSNFNSVRHTESAALEAMKLYKDTRVKKYDPDKDYGTPVDYKYY